MSMSSISWWNVNWSVLANWCLVCSQGAKEQWQLCALTFPLSSQSKATVTMTKTPVLVGNNRLGCIVSYNDKKKTIIDQLVFMFMYCCFLKAEEGLFSERQRFPTALWQLLTHLSATDSTSRKYFDTWDGCAFVFFDKTSLQHNSSHYLDTSQLMEVQSNGGETVSGKTEERQSWQPDKQGEEAAAGSRGIVANMTTNPNGRNRGSSLHTTVHISASVKPTKEDTFVTVFARLELKFRCKLTTEDGWHWVTGLTLILSLNIFSIKHFKHFQMRIAQASLAPTSVSPSARKYKTLFDFHSVSVSESSQSVEVTLWWPTCR